MRYPEAGEVDGAVEAQLRAALARHHLHHERQVLGVAAHGPHGQEARVLLVRQRRDVALDGDDACTHVAVCTLCYCSIAL